jgi:prevent-host-death family protein
MILAMGISRNDSIPLTQVRARFTELVREVKAGAEKIITRDGEPYVALIDPERLAHYHRLARERMHLLLTDEASRGLDDVAAGRIKDARGTIRSIKRGRRA